MTVSESKGRMMPEEFEEDPPVREITHKSSATVLLVSDDPDLCRALEQVMRHVGFRVFIAMGRHRAVELFVNHFEEISAVVVDSTDSGFQVHKILDQIHAVRADAPVMLLSSRQLEDQALRHDGWASLATKPLEIARLVQSVLEMMVPPPPAARDLDADSPS